MDGCDMKTWAQIEEDCRRMRYALAGPHRVDNDRLAYIVSEEEYNSVAKALRSFELGLVDRAESDIAPRDIYILGVRLVRRELL